MTKEEIKARQKEEDDIIKGVIYPKLVKEYGVVHSDIIYIYRQFEPILSIAERRKLIDEFLVLKYKNSEQTSTCMNIAVEQWSSQKLTDMMIRHRKCTNQDCDWECPISKATLYHYCARCGKLLPYREEVKILNSSEYKDLKAGAEKSGWKKIKETIFW